MSKINNIISGWKNYIFHKPEIEQIANDRAEHCAKCDNAIEGWYEVIRDQNIESISGMVCNGCPTKVKCPLSTKLRSPEETCPQKKW